MHGPRRANQKTVAGQQTASPLETPPQGAGNNFESNGRPHQSANETVAMRNSASESEKNRIVVKSERPDYRRTFPTSAHKYGRYEGDCK
jgi:hypothetical protein